MAHEPTDIGISPWIFAALLPIVVLFRAFWELVLFELILVALIFIVLGVKVWLEMRSERNVE